MKNSNWINGQKIESCPSVIIQSRKCFTVRITWANTMVRSFLRGPIIVWIFNFSRSSKRSCYSACRSSLQTLDLGWHKWMAFERPHRNSYTNCPFSYPTTVFLKFSVWIFAQFFFSILTYFGYLLYGNHLNREKKFWRDEIFFNDFFF